MASRVHFCDLPRKARLLALRWRRTGAYRVGAGCWAFADSRRSPPVMQCRSGSARSATELSRGKYLSWTSSSKMRDFSCSFHLWTLYFLKATSSVNMILHVSCVGLSLSTQSAVPGGALALGRSLHVGATPRPVGRPLFSPTARSPLAGITLH